MSTINLVKPGRCIVTKQDGWEWRVGLRRGPEGFRIGGSEVGAALGMSQYATPRSLWQYIHWQKQGFADVKIQGQEHLYALHENESSALKHGKDSEPRVVELYKLLTGTKEIEPGNYWECTSPSKLWPARNDSKYYGCSPDGKMPARLLECKAPENIPAKDILPSYMAQVHYQMATTGVMECDFMSVFYRPKETDTWPQSEKTKPWDVKEPEEDILLWRVHFNQKYWDWMYPRMKEFTHEYLVPKIQPPMLEKLNDPLKIKEIRDAMRIEKAHQFVPNWQKKLKAMRYAAHSGDESNFIRLCSQSA